MSGRQSWMERCIAAALEVDDSIIDSAFKETHTSSKVKAFLGIAKFYFCKFALFNYFFYTFNLFNSLKSIPV